MEMAKAIARDPKVVLIDEPFAGLTVSGVAAFSRLIRGLRESGHAVLLVDHNVKSVAALVDRVLAMYVGERIAEGTADEVMRNETVRRVYLGGAIEAVARRETQETDKPVLLQLDDVSVFYDRAQALERVAIAVRRGEFVSIVGLNGAGKTTLFNAVSGLVPYTGQVQLAVEDNAKSGMAVEKARKLVEVGKVIARIGTINNAVSLSISGVA